MRKKLKIVLKEDVANLGTFGEIKEVAAGYARNFLVPKGAAIYLKDPTSKQLLKRAEEVRKEIEIEIEKLKQNAQKLEGKTIVIKTKVGDKGQLYGSIGPEEVIEKINKEYKIRLDKKQIQMEPIKEIREGRAQIKLGQSIEANIKIKIEPEKQARKKK